MSELSELLEEPAQRFNPESYDATLALAEKWLPRLGGYEYQVTEELTQGRPAILSPKHTGMMDIPLLAVSTDKVYNRRIRFVGKRELWELPLVGERLGAYFYARGGISIDRSVKLADQPAKEEVAEVLENGELLGLFGEGTRVRSRTVGKIKKGMGALAIQHNAPIQAVGIAGTRHWYGRKAVVFGRVIYPETDGVDVENPRSLIRHAKALALAVHHGMQEATDDAYRLRDRMSISFPLFPSS